VLQKKPCQKQAQNCSTPYQNKDQNAAEEILKISFLMASNFYQSKISLYLNPNIILS
jgi:hypothetical protein